VENQFKIFTDGGCSGNPGPGGWAYVIIKDGVPFTEKWGAEKLTTNNRMELQAVIAALEFLALVEKKEEKIAVYTDSQYVQKGITLWLAEWKKKGAMAAPGSFGRAFFCKLGLG